jgi:hypothetical protein
MIDYTPTEAGRPSLPSRAVKARTRAWANRNPVRAAIVLNLVMILTTAVFTVVALGPDSLLDEDCSATSRSCIDSHGSAALWAILSGILTALILGRTLWAAKKGRFKKSEEAEDPATLPSDPT